MRLSVVIPAYNEGRAIRENLEAFLGYLRRQDFSFELIAVDDGSTDSTKAVLEALAGKAPELRCLSHGKNRGKGAAVKTGVLAARGDYAVFLDADGATAIEHIGLIWLAFDSGAKVVIGSRNPRDVPGAKIEIAQNKWKQFLGKAGNFLVQGLTGLPYRDTQCGFKAFAREPGKEIFSRLKTEGWGFDIELLLLAEALGYRIGVIPVVWKNAAGSRVGLKGYLATLWELALIRQRLSKKP